MEGGASTSVATQDLHDRDLDKAAPPLQHEPTPSSGPPADSHASEATHLKPPDSTWMCMKLVRAHLRVSARDRKDDEKGSSISAATIKATPAKRAKVVIWHGGLRCGPAEPPPIDESQLRCAKPSNTLDLSSQKKSNSMPASEPMGPNLRVSARFPGWFPSGRCSDSPRAANLDRLLVVSYAPSRDTHKPSPNLFRALWLLHGSVASQARKCEAQCVEHGAALQA